MFPVHLRASCQPKQQEINNHVVKLDTLQISIGETSPVTFVEQLLSADTVGQD